MIALPESEGTTSAADRMAKARAAKAAKGAEAGAPKPRIFLSRGRQIKRPNAKGGNHIV